MCFASQPRTLFRHLNFQKWSEPGVFCTFWLRNVLRATTACTFSTSQLPKVVRTPQFLTHFTSKCASRHNGNFSFLISPDVSAPAALASLLFNHPEPQNHEKTQCFATFLPFRAPASSFFWSFLFWLFSLLTAFSSLHIVGSLASKLPSKIYIYISPPFNPGIFGGGKARNFWEIFHLTTWNIPPHVFFWASKRRGGGFLRMLFLFGPF